MAGRRQKFQGNNLLANGSGAARADHQVLKDLREECANAAALLPRTARDQHRLIKATAPMSLREWLKSRNSSTHLSKVLRPKCISECSGLGKESCGCPISGSIQDHTRWGLGQPGVVEGAGVALDEI